MSKDDSHEPLRRETLREIAERRRGDPDIRTLGLEIQRLWKVLKQVETHTAHTVMALKKIEDQMPMALLSPIIELLGEEPGLYAEIRLKEAKGLNVGQKADLDQARAAYPGLTDEQALTRLARDRRG